MTRKRWTLMFNSDQVGGAERSLLEQALVMGVERCEVFLPELSARPSPLERELRRRGFAEIHTYPYPRALYRLSRRNAASVVGLLPALVDWGQALLRLSQLLRERENFYLNGNKAAVLLLSWGLFTRPRKFVWHLRDFPPAALMRAVAWALRFPRVRRHWELRFVANSHAVARELRALVPDARPRILYNLPGELAVRRAAPSKITRIGVAAMAGPWKGIHEVIIMSALYQRELEDLGVEEVVIYGAEIYYTQGHGGSYLAELHALAEKLQARLVRFAGQRPPSEIFQEIDLLVHSSLEPEPFGRVIIEAFRAQVPVVSTGLGGSRELVGESQQRALTYLVHDYHGLFDAIRRLATDPKLVQSLTQEAHRFAGALEAQTREELSDLF